MQFVFNDISILVTLNLAAFKSFLTHFASTYFRSKGKKRAQPPASSASKFQRPTAQASFAKPPPAKKSKPVPDDSDSDENVSDESLESD